MKKTAIITGGNRGIGFAIARQLGRDGFNIVITGTSPKERYAANLKKLEEEGIPYAYAQGSVADETGRRRALDCCLDAFGRVDVLVNNAGIAPGVRMDILDMTEESYDAVLAVNLKGALFLTQLVAKRMLAQAAADGLKGIIVNISSVSSYASSITRAEYCISKAGMSMTTSLFADRLAGEGIPVYEVRPGIIETDMTAGVKQKYDALLKGGLCPIARWGKPEDVASAVSLLCSGRLAYSTGQVIDVDGGFHLRRL